MGPGKVPKKETRLEGKSFYGGDIGRKKISL